MDLTIFGIRGTWVGWVDETMTLDRPIGRGLRYIGFTGTTYNPARVLGYASYEETAAVSLYGWRIITTTITDYNFPTYGENEYMLSMWVSVGGYSNDFIINILRADDYGNPGDNYNGIEWCIALIGYSPNTGFVESESFDISKLPNGSITRIFALDTQLRSNTGEQPKEFWLGGYDATILTTLGL